jgi:intracellular sulfur oxidation DsrE/DsrF family protein
VSDFPDIAVLRTAGGEGALPLLRVFISGFASRHDLPVDRLDDIQLAVEALLAEEPEAEGDVILEISAVGGGLRLRLDGLRNQSVMAALAASVAFQPCEGCLLDVRVLLDSLVDGYRVLDATAGSFSVEMNKRTS